ncbi:MAG: SRPBCC domain-containing protein, partial [Cyanobacteria bacterium HKST-UBA02]|nr:SRPBCC domain-containing protein [Cyanobacteria bacterium HKST-UBA02]
MDTYDWSQFHVRMYYLAPLEQVFRYFSTAEGLESFFIYKAVHTAPGGATRQPAEQVQTGDSYHWTYVHYFAHGGEYLLVKPNKLVRFTFGTMTVDISFRDVDGATEVDLHQT